MGQGNPAFKFFAKSKTRDSGNTGAPTFYLPYETKAGKRSYTEHVKQLVTMVFGFSGEATSKTTDEYTGGLNELATVFSDGNIRLVVRDLGDLTMFGFVPARDAAENEEHVNELLQELHGLKASTYADIYEKQWEKDLAAFNDKVNFIMGRIAISFCQICNIGYPIDGYIGGSISMENAMDEKLDYAQLSKE